MSEAAGTKIAETISEAPGEGGGGAEPILRDSYELCGHFIPVAQVESYANLRLGADEHSEAGKRDLPKSSFPLSAMPAPFNR